MASRVEVGWHPRSIDQERRAGDDMVEGEESVGDSFPEIMLAANALPSDVCLDGEILAWGKDGLRSFSEAAKKARQKNSRSWNLEERTRSFSGL